MERVAEEVWLAEEAAHGARIRPVVEPYLVQRSHGRKLPVPDFLFTYYSYSPASLLMWTPGVGRVLEGRAAQKFLGRKHFVEVDGGVMLDVASFPRHRIEGARWIVALQEQLQVRPPRFGCFGLHEWAMVYRTKDVRHAQTPLRMAPDDLARFVESQRVCCSHYDAFRFFTPDAVPLNSMRPTLADRQRNEQAGCVHVNMDLYKWAYKFQPWLGSGILADAFLLALELRELDMRASPYDLSADGYEPIRIETEEGRAQYAAMQADLARRAAPVRAALLQAYRNLLRLVDTCPGQEDVTPGQGAVYS